MLIQQNAKYNVNSLVFFIVNENERHKITKKKNYKKIHNLKKKKNQSRRLNPCPHRVAASFVY